MLNWVDKRRATFPDAQQVSCRPRAASAGLVLVNRSTRCDREALGWLHDTCSLDRAMYLLFMLRSVYALLSKCWLIPGNCCGRYNHPDIIITENGVCLPGEADAPLPGVLNDVRRIEFLRDYLQSVMQAVKTDKVGMHCNQDALH